MLLTFSFKHYRVVSIHRRLFQVSVTGNAVKPTNYIITFTYVKHCLLWNQLLTHSRTTRLFQSLIVVKPKWTWTHINIHLLIYFHMSRLLAYFTWYCSITVRQKTNSRGTTTKCWNAEKISKKDHNVCKHWPRQEVANTSISKVPHIIREPFKMA